MFGKQCIHNYKGGLVRILAIRFMVLAFSMVVLKPAIVFAGTGQEITSPDQREVSAVSATGTNPLADVLDLNRYFEGVSQDSAGSTPNAPTPAPKPGFFTRLGHAY